MPEQQARMLRDLVAQCEVLADVRQRGAGVDPGSRGRINVRTNTIRTTMTGDAAMDTHAPAADAGFEAEILDAIEKWLARDVRPHVMRLDHADEYPHEMVEQMKALGLFGATIPQEYGG